MDGIFPDKLHLFLFSFYICLFVNQGILVTASKEDDGSYAYNTTTVVLLTETIKLCLALGLYYKEKKKFGQLFVDIRASFNVFFLYLIPSFLYCLYNNLAFVNLKHYDPTSYFLLLNFRTAATGVIFQFLFRKKLNRRQWTALLVLTLGCVVKQVRFDGIQSLRIELDGHLALMLLQVFCSCFAGVYNEFLLKDVNTSNVPLMLQNIYMYFNSIIMNIGFLYFNGGLSTAITSQAIASVCQPIVLSIALNNGVAGITTSLFLKMFNSILKTFAGAIELLLTAIAARLLFGIQIDAFMLLSICLVSTAMYLYSTNPVVNKATVAASPILEQRSKTTKRDLEETDDDEVFIKNEIAAAKIGTRFSANSQPDGLLPLKTSGQDLV